MCELRGAGRGGAPPAALAGVGGARRLPRRHVRLGLRATRNHLILRTKGGAVVRPGDGARGAGLARGAMQGAPCA
jgi:hypothetical protein